MLSYFLQVCRYTIVYNYNLVRIVVGSALVDIPLEIGRIHLYLLGTISFPFRFKIYTKNYTKQISIKLIFIR